MPFDEALSRGLHQQDQGASSSTAIILVDNDAGAKNIYGAISEIIRKPRPTGTEQFIHVVGNMYVVPTPLGTGGAKTAIEDFFDAKTLGEKLGTKTFSRAAKFDDTKHFGKAAFAREIVEKNAASIDFRGFSAILDGVVAVMADYAKRHPRRLRAGSLSVVGRHLWLIGHSASPCA